MGVVTSGDLAALSDVSIKVYRVVYFGMLEISIIDIGVY